MPETSPLRIDFGDSQGRLRPSEGLMAPTDGRWVYTVGDEHLQEVSAHAPQVAEVSTSIDFTGSFKALQLDMRWQQALTMPVDKILSGAGSSLKFREVFGAKRPVVKANLQGPYVFPVVASGSYTLSVSIDGGPEQLITISASDAKSTTHTLAELIEEINKTLTGGEAFNTDTSDLTLATLGIRSASSGYQASVTIGTVVSDDANAYIEFPTMPTYGGDVLSALVAPTTVVEDHEVGATVAITGSTVGNDGNREVMAKTEIAGVPALVLYPPLVASESSDFVAALHGCSWRLQVGIDSVPLYSRLLAPGETVRTNDIVLNVSKLSGTHIVSVWIELVSVWIELVE
jgi:hypothetical protein